MASKFLDDLKKSVETGDFNSEAAKKIIEVDKVAGGVTNTRALDFAVEKAFKEGAIKTLTEEEALVLNTEYEKEMERIKKVDLANSQLAILTEIEEMVELSISDMISFVKELKDKFGKDFEEQDPAYLELLEKINKINMKYNNSIINN
jgi:hypothetical protein